MSVEEEHNTQAHGNTRKVKQQDETKEKKKSRGMGLSGVTIYHSKIRLHMPSKMTRSALVEAPEFD